jgi:hypothetical protein
MKPAHYLSVPFFVLIWLAVCPTTQQQPALRNCAPQSEDSVDANGNLWLAMKVTGGSGTHVQRSFPQSWVQSRSWDGAYNF